MEDAKIEEIARRLREAQTLVRESEGQSTTERRQAAVAAARSKHAPAVTAIKKAVAAVLDESDDTSVVAVYSTLSEERSRLNIKNLEGMRRLSSNAKELMYARRIVKAMEGLTNDVPARPARRPRSRTSRPTADK